MANPDAIIADDEEQLRIYLKSIEYIEQPVGWETLKSAATSET